MNHIQLTRTIDITDYGYEPNSWKDAGEAVQSAIQDAEKIEEHVTLYFPKGQYDFYPEDAIKKPYYISNTASETQNPDVTKTIGILLKNMKNITIEGNGSLFQFHGAMTSIVLDTCEKITIQNVQIDYARPTTSEMSIQEIGTNEFIAKVHEDSLYEIRDGKITWVSERGENKQYYWEYRAGNAQVYDPVTETFKRTWNPGGAAVCVEEIEQNLLKFHYQEQPNAKVGQIFTMREDIRNEVGIFIEKSKDVTMNHVGMHYMHGLGVVFQYSENLTVQSSQFAPRKESGRITAGFADFIQVSGGKGEIKISDSYFSGPNDDPINIHGTHVRIVEKRNDKQIVIRFMNHQTYGFDPIFVDDTIELIHVDTLTAYGCAQITNVERINLREFILTIDKELPQELKVNDVIENITWTPSVEIKNNVFERMPTRAILVTTRQPVVIEGNTFKHAEMSAILISDDASSWYESGMVKDVRIQNNKFINNGNPVIMIHPENQQVDWRFPVHQNIRVENNQFEMSDSLEIQVKSTSGFEFLNNAIHAKEVQLQFVGSKESKVSRNQFTSKVERKYIHITQSENSTIDIGSSQKFIISDQ